MNGELDNQAKGPSDKQEAAEDKNVKGADLGHAVDYLAGPDTRTTRDEAGAKELFQGDKAEKPSVDDRIKAIEAEREATIKALNACLNSMNIKTAALQKGIAEAPAGEVVTTQDVAVLSQGIQELMKKFEQASQTA